MKRIFDWDPVKAAANWRKHGVTFEAAASVFTDPFAITFLERFEAGEARWMTIGATGAIQLLVLIHTDRELDEAGAAFEIIRIISARKAVPSERRRYENEDDRSI